jgi:hypothetical protein
MYDCAHGPHAERNFPGDQRAAGYSGRGAERTDERWQRRCHGTALIIPGGWGLLGSGGDIGDGGVGGATTVASMALKVRAQSARPRCRGRAAVGVPAGGDGGEATGFCHVPACAAAVMEDSVGQGAALTLVFEVQGPLRCAIVNRHISDTRPASPEANWQWLRQPQSRPCCRRC